MAKLSSIQKNLFRQKLIKKFKTKRESLKSKIKNKNISLEEISTSEKKSFELKFTKVFSDTVLGTYTLEFFKLLNKITKQKLKNNIIPNNKILFFIYSFK